MKGKVLNDSSIVNECVSKLNSNQVSKSLISHFNKICDITKTFPYRYISFISNEVGILTQALFFYYSIYSVIDFDELENF